MENNNPPELTQVEVVTLAVYLLGGVSHAIDTEDVAIKVNELAPGRFTWRKHPEQVNLELVRVYLSDAKKPDKGSYVAGSGKTGWTLTVDGRQWASSMAERVSPDALERSGSEQRSGSVDSRRGDRERKRIQLTESWREWDASRRGPTREEARRLFRIDHYTTSRMEHMKINRLLDLLGDDPTVGDFLREARHVLDQEGGPDGGS